MANKHGEPISGLLLLNKPLDISSNSALQKTMRLLNGLKAGHTGSLDPRASGMLPICFGEAPKFSRFLFDSDKCYDVVMQLGEKTSTGDTEGDIIAQASPQVLSMADMQRLFTHFTGIVHQIPSMYSAIKHNGQPLYKLARQGKSIERKIRDITIHRIDYRDYDAFNHQLSFAVVCSKGTYIRTLVDDMGDLLGCGAHVKVLHRRYVSPFDNLPMFTLEQLADMSLEERRAKLIPVKQMLASFFPQVHLSDSQTLYLRQGREIQKDTQIPPGWVALVTPQGDFLGIGQCLIDGRIAPRRLVQQN